MNNSNWTHPELGIFKFDEWAWIGKIDAPSFHAFAYSDRKGKYELAFEAEDESDIPSPAAVELALKVLAEQSKLVSKVTTFLWNDFNGKGPDTGMWWHGDLNQIAENMEFSDSPQELTSKDDILDVMSLSSITVRTNDYPSDSPLVELSFHAPFEEEHGIGILTDGDSIVGIGYSADVFPLDGDKYARSEESMSSTEQLWGAILENDEPRIKELLAAGADINATEDPKADPPLHAAINMSNLELVRTLLKYGANPNVKDPNGRTPLKKLRKTMKQLGIGPGQKSLFPKFMQAMLPAAAAMGLFPHEEIAKLLEAAGGTE